MMRLWRSGYYLKNVPQNLKIGDLIVFDRSIPIYEGPSDKDREIPKGNICRIVHVDFEMPASPFHNTTSGYIWYCGYDNEGKIEVLSMKYEAALTHGKVIPEGPSSEILYGK